MSTLSKGTLFPETVAQDMFSKIVGHSSLAKLSGQKPVQFNGNDVFVFDFAKEIAIVAENAAKPAGDASVTAVKIAPIKVVYQSRVSDEFMYAAEEVKLRYLNEFADGFAKKLARGLDIMALHGKNPYDGQAASSTIGNNHLDYVIANYSSGANVITLGHDSSAIDANVEEALAKVEDAEYSVTGVIMAPAARTAMANLTQNSGERKYPEFAFGGTPASLGSGKLDVNSTVSANSNLDRVLVGDFANAFRWGIAKELPLEVIQFGNPDGGTYDLKQANQVCLRSEAYIGWGFLNPAAFAAVKQGE